MNILLKFTLKNMKEKKFRLALILISVTLSTALFFASSALGSNVEGLFSSQMKSFVGDSDIRISSGEDRSNVYFYEEAFGTYKEHTEYIIGGLFLGGSYKTSADESIPFNLVCFDLEDIAIFNPITLTQQLNGVEFSGRQIILDHQFALDNNFTLGDTIELTLFGDKQNRFIVWGIANPSGLFMVNGNNSNMMIPKDTASRLAGVPGKVNTLLMKGNEGTKYELLEDVKAKMKGYEVEESLSMDEIKSATAQVSAMFQIMLVLVIFISMFIIYTSFKVIMMERLPVIGTFRSVGATKRSTNSIMLGESLFYGLVGGILGDLIGIGILFGMTRVMAYNPYTKTTTDFMLKVEPIYLILAIAFAVILSLVSSLIPILQVSKIPVKDIILNKITPSKKRKPNRLKPFYGLFLLTFSIIIPITSLIQGNMVMSVVCMITSIIGLLMMVPMMVKSFITFAQKPFELIFGHIGSFALKNINDNKNIMNNIVLLTIGIASLFMINVISYSVAVEVVDVYNSAEFDLWAWVSETDSHNIDRIVAVDGVNQAYGIYEATNIKLWGTEEAIGIIEGAVPQKHFDYWDYNLLGDREAIIHSLDKGRNIILNKAIGDKFGYSVGDTITLEILDKPRNYKIIGMMSTLMNNGQFAIISDKYFKADFKPRYYDKIYIRTDGDSYEVNKMLVKKFKDTGIWSNPLKELQKNNEESNNQIFVLLQGFSIMTMIIGIFGVFNNYIVNMLSRKRSLAMYRSVGMSMKTMRKMLYIESMSGGLVGGLMGLLGGIIFVFLVGYVMQSMNLPVKMHINPMLLIQSFVGGIVVSVIASISPVIRSSKMEIIEAIKYE